MYITGTISDFASRLHELATGASDLGQFKTEVSGYWANYDANTQIKLQTEAGRIIYEISGNAALPIHSYF